MTDWPYELGDIVVGVVVSIKQYGAFIKVDDVVGLLHISDISRKRVNSVGSIFKVWGQQLLE